MKPRPLPELLVVAKAEAALNAAPPMVAVMMVPALSGTAGGEPVEVCMGKTPSVMACDCVDELPLLSVASYWNVPGSAWASESSR